MRNSVSQFECFQLLDKFINGRGVPAIIHEVALMDPTGGHDDIDFIRRLEIGDDGITRWESYRETTQGFAAVGARAERSPP